MKKYISIAVILILVAVIGYLFYSGDGKESDLKKQLSEIEEKYKTKQDSIKSIIDVLNDSITKDFQVVDNFKKAEQTAKKQAKEWKDRYNELNNIIPVDQRDSLLNCFKKEVALLGALKETDVALNKCDSTNIAYVKIISNKDFINDNLTNIILDNRKEIEDIKMTALKSNKDQYKKGRNKGRKQGGLVGFLSGAGLTLLIFL